MVLGASAVIGGLPAPPVASTDWGVLNGVSKARAIGDREKKNGTFSERHRKAAITLAHLKFATKTRTVVSVCFSRFLSGAVGHTKRHRGQRYRSGDVNPRRGCPRSPL